VFVSQQMYKYEKKPWWTQGGRNLEELITLEMNAAVRDLHRPPKTKFNQSTSMRRILRMDFFQVEHELDGAKPLVNLDASFQPPEPPLPSKKPVRNYPPPRIVDIEDGGSEISYPTDVPRSKCAVRPYFYGNVPGRMINHR
jgi:hypothetical protein